MIDGIWHDLECGSYSEDLGLWRELADRHGGPVLDVGAGTGRITLALGRAGHAVTALDVEAELLEALRERAVGLDVTTVVADARAFSLGTRFALCIVPMQTVQLLGGTDGRRAFLGCARQHLAPGGELAIAIADELDLFEIRDGELGPLPDVREIDGVVYSSRATAVRADGDGFVLERRRETVSATGERSVTENRIHLDAVQAEALEEEAIAAGLRVHPRRDIPPTDDYVGSTVVMLGA
ncbi:MAG: class I SAM-dependent methyltransferase [Solirubrobacteraceae bacterium]